MGRCARERWAGVLARGGPECSQETSRWSPAVVVMAWGHVLFSHEPAGDCYLLVFGPGRDSPLHPSSRIFILEAVPTVITMAIMCQ